MAARGWVRVARSLGRREDAMPGLSIAARMRLGVLVATAFLAFTASAHAGTLTVNATIQGAGRIDYQKFDGMTATPLAACVSPSANVPNATVSPCGTQTLTPPAGQVWSMLLDASPIAGWQFTRWD